MIQGSSIASAVFDHVRKFANDYNCVVVCLDSNHTHDHVIAKLDAYAALASIGSYCVVFDTVVAICLRRCFRIVHGGLAITP
jgi:cephalosporin hydroxylase